MHPRVTLWVCWRTRRKRRQNAVLPDAADRRAETCTHRFAQLSRLNTAFNSHSLKPKLSASLQPTSQLNVTSVHALSPTLTRTRGTTAASGPLFGPHEAYWSLQGRGLHNKHFPIGNKNAQTGTHTLQYNRIMRISHTPCQLSVTAFEHKAYGTRLNPSRDRMTGTEACVEHTHTHAHTKALQNDGISSPNYLYMMKPSVLC